MSYILAALLLAPFFILGSRLTEMTNPFRPEFFHVLAQTLAQALASSALSVFLGVFGALGLLSLARSRARKWVEIFVLAPSLLPTLFIIVAALNLVNYVGRFPFGLGGVILLHVLIHVGLVSVVLARRMESAMGGAVELATIEGATQWQTLRAVLGGLKRDLALTGFFVFAITFSAFSVPLIVGADRGETLEVLIYRAVLGQGDLGYGLGLSFIQLGVVAIFSLMIPRATADSTLEPRFFARLQSKTALVILLGATTLLLLSSFHGLPEGVREVLRLEPLFNALKAAAWGTLLECFLVGGLVWGLLAFVVYVFPHSWLHKFLLAYTAPSAVVMALAFYLVFDSHSASAPVAIVAIAVGFSLLILPSLFRFRAASRLTELEAQVLTARVLGAGRWQIFTKVTLPQVHRDLGFLAGVAALWASGDFAFASLVAGRELTLAISAQNFLGGYRMEVATVVTWLSLLLGFFVYLCFQVVSDVGHKKSRS